MANIIRKIVVGPNPKDAMAYYVGMRAGQGNVSAIMAQATNFKKLGNIIAGQIPLLFSAVPVGTFMPTQVIAVEDKGTTATNIVALW